MARVLVKLLLYSCALLTTLQLTEELLVAGTPGDADVVGECRRQFGLECNWCRDGLGCMDCRPFYKLVYNPSDGLNYCERTESEAELAAELDYVSSPCSTENCVGDPNPHCADRRWWGCARCEDDYFMRTNDYPCVLCSMIPHCVTCSIDERNWLGCDECESGYERTWDTGLKYRRCLNTAATTESSTLSPTQPPRKYEIRAATADRPGAGIPSDVHFSIYGEDGVWSESFQKDFAGKDLDRLWNVWLPDVGDAKKIAVWHYDTSTLNLIRVGVDGNLVEWAADSIKLRLTYGGSDSSGCAFLVANLETLKVEESSNGGTYDSPGANCPYTFMMTP